MLVYDYLDYVAGIRGLDRQKKAERIKTMVELCGLKGIMHKTIGELSKGLKQRVGLAHAMIDDPEILVLDEPTSGLDPNQIVEIRDIIRSIGKDKTIVLSTHILSEAEATCDRIVIIDKGGIVADGSTEMLKMGTGHDKTIYLTLKDAGLAQAREVLSGVKGVSRIHEEPSAEDELRLKLTISTPDDPREAIYRTIKATDWTLLELHQEGKSLEKIFRELTQEA
jgi:ABC-2 type transport system ATP-binding protein